MRSSLTLAVLLFALLASPATAAAGTSGCTDTATVGWEVDLAEIVVTGATLDVPGCADGERIGLQLITDDGDIPLDGPIVADVVDERAMFDLTEHSPRVEPVIGVRVFLMSHPDADPYLEITVDQRFFNLPGNEQVGLRTITVLRPGFEDLYTVPGPTGNYLEVRCADVGVSSAETIAEGSGTFSATASGVHLVCYRMQPGPPGGPPFPDPPEVLDETIELDVTAVGSDDAEVLPASEEKRVSPLPITGRDLVVMVGLGSLLLVSGLYLRSRHQRGGVQPLG